MVCSSKSEFVVETSPERGHSKAVACEVPPGVEMNSMLFPLDPQIFHNEGTQNSVYLFAASCTAAVRARRPVLPPLLTGEWNEKNHAAGMRA